MRVAVVTESFLPHINGVTNSVLRVCEHLQQRGHDVLVIAPGEGPTEWAGARVVRTPALPLPGYTDVQVGRPWRKLVRTLREFQPDVVHLASPTVLGAQAASAARRIGLRSDACGATRLPMVAVYQTDLAGFAARYGLGAADGAVWRWLRHVHGMAGRTLAPSRCAVADLERNGVLRVMRWARGVDLERFHPRHRDGELRAHLAPGGELLVGYVGRLAREKQVELLAGLEGQPGVRLVVVGEGPQRESLQRAMPSAQFLGFQSGAQLAGTFASLDVFVHTGAHETFCQSAQEALASGLPVVGPAAGGLLDLVQPGRTGRLFEPGSARSLREQVQAVSADPTGRLVMAARARASVQNRGWDVIGDELLQHYHHVMSP